jgi:cation diffusion facilitator family transporter
MRLFYPRPVAYLGIVVVASLVGFFGNEAVAIFRIRVGRDIGSAALVADGIHARVDGWTSLAVLAGAFGIWLGYPMADPIVGLLIAAAILWLVWQAGWMVVIRAVDGIDPAVLAELRHSAQHAPGVQAVTEVQARWVGHRLRTELNIAVSPPPPWLKGMALPRKSVINSSTMCAISMRSACMSTRWIKRVWSITASPTMPTTAFRHIPMPETLSLR